jgi:hypothetical protein
MKYQFFCKNCGDSFISDDKKVRNEYEENHYKRRIIKNKFNTKECVLIKTKRGTFARPSLVDQINEEI